MSTTYSPTAYTPAPLLGPPVPPLQDAWTDLSGRGPHPLFAGAAGACPGATGSHAHIPPHSTPQGRGCTVGCKVSQHWRGPATGMVYSLASYAVLIVKHTMCKGIMHYENC